MTIPLTASLTPNIQSETFGNQWQDEHIPVYAGSSAVRVRTTNSSPTAKYLAGCRFHELGNTVSDAPAIDQRSIRRFAQIDTCVQNTRGELRGPVNRSLSPVATNDERNVAKDRYALLMAKRLWASGDISKNYVLSKLMQMGNCAENAMSTYLNLAHTLRAGIGSRDNAGIDLMQCNNDHAFTRVRFTRDAVSVIADAWSDDPPIFEKHLNQEFSDGLKVDASLDSIHQKNSALRKADATLRVVHARRDRVLNQIQQKLQAVRNNPKSAQAMFFYQFKPYTIDRRRFDADTKAQEAAVKSTLQRGVIDGATQSDTDNTEISLSHRSEAVNKRANDGSQFALTHDIRAAGIQRSLNAHARKAQHTAIRKELADIQGITVSTVRQNPRTNNITPSSIGPDTRQQRAVRNTGFGYNRYTRTRSADAAYAKPYDPDALRARS